MPRTPVAHALAAILPKQARVEAYDGSTAGDPQAEVVLAFKSPKALSHLVSAPGELGMARAYVSGEMDITAPNHYLALKTLSRMRMADLTVPERLRVLKDLGREALHWVEPPPQEVGAKRYLSGLRAHSRSRDAAAIAHHYDVSNTFYEWVLGPSMAYTCAVFPTADATLEQAQYAKFDLVCRKLGLKPGMRLLDVGCGWGGMAMHAAEHYGVEVIAATLSRQQAEWGRKAAAERGLSDRVDIRYSDYRDVKETGFDAVSSIGLTEHIGIAQLSSYARFLAGKLVPQGRLLNHCITRPDDHSRAISKRGFIARYVFPDGELPAVARIVRELQSAGLEVQHEENLRVHYAKTLTGWCDNLDAHWDEAVEEVGIGTARVWALYLAGSRLGFERNEIELHQVLATRTVDGDNGMPLRPDWLS
ncbi:MAG: class I SAM-dependent methyltransferase [Actinomycetota bacterium]|nr:class I SAM-dependent methyltransferase [Actinomycetota bacterium]